MDLHFTVQAAEGGHPGLDVAMVLIAEHDGVIRPGVDILKELYSKAKSERPGDGQSGRGWPIEAEWHEHHGHSETTATRYSFRYT